jgi:hypothetical protein
MSYLGENSQPPHAITSFLSSITIDTYSRGAGARWPLLPPSHPKAVAMGFKRGGKESGPGAASVSLGGHALQELEHLGGVVLRHEEAHGEGHTVVE